MSPRHSNHRPLIVLEAILWGSGTLLLAGHLTVSAWSAYASDADIKALRASREHTIEPPPTSQPISSDTRLAVGDPDTSRWSPKRLASYLQTRTQGSPPEAVLRIPSLDLEVPVYEGTSKATLDRGAGRIEGTARIDSTHGNLGLAAHRDGFFRVLEHIAHDDTIVLETATATSTYRVTSVKVVAPTDVGVLDDREDARIITLVTCYPFYYVGPAPQRFIVQAMLERPSNPHADAVAHEPNQRRTGAR